MSLDGPLLRLLVLLFLTGAAASIVGSLVGLGGGFLIVPILRLAFGVAPTSATSAALLLVFANTASASFAFFRNKMVEVRSGLIIAAAGIPAGVAGAFAIRMFSQRGFDLLYGGFLLAIAAAVLLRRNEEARAGDFEPGMRLAIELGTGVAVGFFSSLFGIGGGIVLVPVLLMVLRFPIHVVAGTSAFVVTLTSPSGILTHAYFGHFDLRVGTPLVLGGLLGGNIGARLASRVSPKRLTWLLAGLLIAAALALVAKHI